MSRKNRSPEEKARRAKIRELLQMANIDSMDDIQDLFKETIAEFMENGLETELDEDDSSFMGSYGTKSSTGQTNGAIGRYYAVVDKVNAGKDSYIVVMLCNKNNGRTEYYTRKYAVNSSCFTDSKNLMQPSTHLSFSTNKNVSQQSTVSAKVGGITKAETSKKVGGITRA